MTDQTQTQQTVPEQTEQDKEVRWHVACYLRRSVRNPIEPEPETLEKQLAILNDFIASHPDMVLVKTYTDDGYSGINTNRPAFQQMIADAQAQAFNCLVIKDFSRLSRNYIEAGHLIEQDFPRMGLRFISVLDRYDSLVGDKRYIANSMKQIINDIYLQDLSLKASSVIHHKQEHGFHYGGVPFGYRRRSDVKGLLLLDDDAAPVIYLIFAFAKMGRDKMEIAHFLDDLHIPTPQAYEQIQKGTAPSSLERKTWNPDLISKILCTRMYAGDLEYGVEMMRKTASSITGNTEQAHHGILENTIIPYFRREDFMPIMEQEQKRREATAIRRERQRRQTRCPLHPFTGLVWCGECLHKVMLERFPGTRICSAYTCSGSFYRDRRSHMAYSVPVDTVTAQVLDALRAEQEQATQLAGTLDQIGMDTLFSWLITHYTDVFEGLKEQESALIKHRERIDKDKDAGILDPDTWAMQVRRMERENRDIQKKLHQAEQELSEARFCAASRKEILDDLIQADLSKVPKPDVTHQLLLRVEIFRDGSATITAANNRWRTKLAQYIEEWKNRKSGDCK